MIKRKIRVVLLINSMITIVSCVSSVSDKVASIDYQSWNANTIVFLEEKCDIRMNDPIKLGDEIVPVNYKGKVYNTFGDYLESKTKGRNQLISYLKEHANAYVGIHIFESYSRDRANFRVSIDDEHSFSFSFNNEILTLTSSEKLESSEKLFSPLSKDEKECFAEYESIPQNIRIFSRYDMSKNSIVTYQISMYD